MTAAFDFQPTFKLSGVHGGTPSSVCQSRSTIHRRRFYSPPARSVGIVGLAPAELLSQVSISDWNQLVTASARRNAAVRPTATMCSRHALIAPAGANSPRRS